MLRKSELSNLVFSFDLAREEALAKRAIGDEADPKFFKRRQHFRFRVSSSTANIRFGAP